LLFGRVLHAVILECQGAVTKDNFEDSTLGLFRPHRQPSRDPDHIDEDDGEIWVVMMPEPGIVRKASVWGSLNSGCEWHIFPDNGKEVVTGFCPYADMHPDGLEFRAIPDDVLSARGAKQGKPWEAFRKKYSKDHLMRFRTSPNSNERGWCDLLQMRRRLRKHADVNQCIFQGGEPEVSIVGECAETGIEVRTRLDFLKPVDAGRLITDLKSTRETEERAWARQADQNLLFMQAAWQVGMAAHVYDGDLEFVFAVIDKTAPFSPASYDVEGAYLEEGCKVYQEHIREFKKCVDGDREWEREDFGKRRTLVVPEFRIKKSLQEDEKALLQWQNINVG